MKALFWHKKRPFHQLQRPYKHIRRPSHQRRRPSVTRSVILAYDCIILSKYGAPSVCEGVLLSSGTKNILSAHDGALSSRDGAPPASEGPLQAQQALFSLMTAPCEADTGPSHQQRRPSSTKRRPFCASFNQVRCRLGRDRHMTVPLRPSVRFDQTLLAPKVQRSQ